MTTIRSHFEIYRSSEGSINIFVDGCPLLSFSLHEDGIFTATVSNSTDAFTAEHIRNNGKRITEEELLMIIGSMANDKNILGIGNMLRDEAMKFGERLNHAMELMRKEGTLPEIFKSKDQDIKPPDPEMPEPLNDYSDDTH